MVSDCCSTCTLRALPMPCHDLSLIDRKTGRPGSVAARRRAIILRDCAGSTRPSSVPVAMNTAG